MASSFKVNSDPQEVLNRREIKNMLEQNNFTNQNLKTISDQLTRVEDFVGKEKQEVPIFMPHEIAKQYIP